MMPMVAMTAVIAPVVGSPALPAPSPDEYVTNAHRVHAAMAYAIALRATRDPELAEDVTQEAFVKLLTEARAGRYPDRAGAWLYRAVTNLVISRARRATVARRLAPRLVNVNAPDEPDFVALRNEGHVELRLALATLSPAERAALLLAASGASGIEIAAHLGMSHGATRAMICRARARLRARTAGVPGQAA